ncbi:MAG: M56 family metallopeptidase, partial [Bacteroidales bacterium]|nr:M56 family metallopeptidase [Bacteroidales bacterium]
MMHQPILIYAFKVVACSAIFWMFYKGIIEQGRHFTLSRCFLLFALAASAGFPLLSIPVYPAAPPLMIEPLAYPTAPTIGMSRETTAVAAINPWIFALGLYLIVCGALALKLGLQLSALSKFSRSGILKREKACLIIRSPKIASPFSFIRTIYMPQHLELSEETLFLLHERAHIKSRHSLDILFYEILCIFFWFNPILWLMGRELRKVHEYQADQSVASVSPNTRVYKELIAKEFLGFSPKITNAFNGSLTKKRIIMLTQPFKTNRTVLRAALIIPFIALNLLLFSCTAKQ